MPDRDDLAENWLRRCRGDDFLTRFPMPTGAEKVVDVILQRFVTNGANPPNAIVQGAVSGFAADDYADIGEARFLQISYLIESAAELHAGTDEALVLSRIAGQATVQLLLQAWRGSAEEDPLTGLGNRRKMESAVLARERTGASFLYGSIDADGLKTVNDDGGHEAGDALLKKIARAIDEVARSFGGRAYRYGGDEFGIVCDAEDKDAAIAALNEEQSTFPEGTGFSWGIAEWPVDDPDVNAVQGRADGRMYDQKTQRKAARGVAVR